MASSLYFKGNSENYFLHRLKPLLFHTEKQISERKLTLIQIAPVFMFQLAGYVISLLADIGELLLNRNVRVKCFMTTKKQKKIITINQELVWEFVYLVFSYI